MNLFQRLKGRFFTAYAKWKNDSYDFSLWRNRTFWGINNSTLATNETIFSAITRLSNSMASLPLKLHQRYDVKETSVSDLLTNSPNPNMTGFDFIRLLESARNETGNGYAVIERDTRNQPIRIEAVDSNAVVPVIETNTRELWYEVTGDDGSLYYFHNMNMIHVKHISSVGNIVGIDPLKVLTNSTDFDKAVREFSLSEMRGAPNSFILKYG